MAFTIYNVGYTENESQLGGLSNHDAEKAFQNRPRKRGEMCYKRGIIFTVNHWHWSDSKIAKAMGWFKENGSPMQQRVVHVRNLARSSGMVDKGMQISKLNVQIAELQRRVDKKFEDMDKVDVDRTEVTSVDVFKFSDMLHSLGKTQQKLEQKKDALAVLKVAV